MLGRTPHPNLPPKRGRDFRLSFELDLLLKNMR
jgi:hypothetical protein